MSQFSKNPYIETILADISGENKAKLLNFVNGKSADGTGTVSYTLVEDTAAMIALAAGVHAVELRIKPTITWKGYFVKSDDYKTFISFGNGIDLQLGFVYKVAATSLICVEDVDADYLRALLREDSYIDPTEGGHLIDLENGSGTSALQQKQDGTGGTFDFTNKNSHATALDPTLTGNIAYGGVGNFATSFGGKSQASGKRSVAQGTTTVAKGNYSHAEGDNSVALGNDSHAEGYKTVSKGAASHAEGADTQSVGANSHAEGSETITNAQNSHAEGEGSKTLVNANDKPAIPDYGEGDSGGGEGDDPQPTPSQNGSGSHAEGILTNACGNASHAEGISTWATSYGSHAEGYGSQATNDYAHAEGYNCLASGYGSHATGVHTVASANYTFSQGRQTQAKNDLASAFGYKTVTGRDNQMVVGQNNVETADALFVVGNGMNDTPSNAFEVLANGTIKVGGQAFSAGTKLYSHRLDVTITNGITGDVVVFEHSAFEYVDNYDSIPTKASPLLTRIRQCALSLIGTVTISNLQYLLCAVTDTNVVFIKVTDGTFKVVPNMWDNPNVTAYQTVAL